MKNICLIIFAVILLQNQLLFGGEIRDRAINSIENKFGKNVEILTYKVNLNKKLKQDAEKFARQRFFGNFVYYYEIRNNEDVMGYAMLDNVLGKVKPITYLVIFDKNLSVISVKIIKYREEHGGAVESQEWLSQFENKNIKSNIELDNTIDGISGATISVKSVINGVKLLLSLINNLGQDEKDLLVSTE